MNLTNVLKLRKKIQQERSKENKQQLKTLIQDDIIGSIRKNYELGNINAYDAELLLRLTKQLYDHMYAHYEELEDVSDMTDQSIITDIDIIQLQHEKELEEKDILIAEKDVQLEEKDNMLAEKDNMLEEKDELLDEKEKTLTLLSQENTRLSAELAKVKDLLSQYKNK